MGGLVTVHDWRLAIHKDEAVFGKFDGAAEALELGAGDFSVDGVWERKECPAEMLEVAGKESNVGGVLGHEDDLDAGGGSEFGEPVGGVLSATER